MEYLIVHCPQKRSVMVDGVRHGETEDPIELEAGTYTITLEPADGSQPAQHQVVLLSTTLISPCEVSFALV
ncbi:MAG: hypothetical protein HY613_05765 [Candidatus Rokubacteria bacterium]|nr:hypothetical protein [Candidatus Rokubacteria bacterium]